MAIEFLRAYLFVEIQLLYCKAIWAVDCGVTFDYLFRVIQPRFKAPSISCMCDVSWPTLLPPSRENSWSSSKQKESIFWANLKPPRNRLSLLVQYCNALLNILCPVIVSRGTTKVIYCNWKECEAGLILVAENLMSILSYPKQFINLISKRFI